MKKKHIPLPMFLKRKQEKKKSESTPEKLEMMITIVERGKSDKFIDIFQQYNVNVSMVVLGKGTAPTELLNLLGIAEPSKDVILSLILEKNIMPLYEEIQNLLKIEGKGVSLTIPLTSMVGITMYKFLSHENIKKGEIKNG